MCKTGTKPLFQKMMLLTWYQVPNRRIDGTICSIEAYKRTQYNVKSGRKTIQNDSNCRWR